MEARTISGIRSFRRESPMAKRFGASRRLSSRDLRWHPYSMNRTEILQDNCKKSILTLEKKDWEDATCSVCLEYPHNAVLLLCSSHDKGCRPYMCGTSYRQSNCLAEFRKAYTKEVCPHQDSSLGYLGLSWPSCKSSVLVELACPLCRGQVKGFTVVEPARQYLNKKKRSCMHVNCSFKGTYKKLRKHVKSMHPRAKPRKVDPVLERKWKMLEHQREQADVISTIRSSMPGSVVLGDYVIDMNSSDSEEGDRSINRRVLNYILRDGALLLRFQRNNTVPEDRQEFGRHFPEMDNSAFHSSDEDDSDDDDDDMFVQSFRSEILRHRHRPNQNHG